MQAELRRKAETEMDNSRQVTRFLKEMLEGAGPSVALGRDPTLLKEILDRSSVWVAELKQQPDVQAELLRTMAGSGHGAGRLRPGLEPAQPGPGAASTCPRSGRRPARPGDAAVASRARADEAERTQRRALEMLEKTLPQDHPDLLNCMDDLAMILMDKNWRRPRGCTTWS